jgi:hypothetical protein
LEKIGKRPKNKIVKSGLPLFFVTIVYYTAQYIYSRKEHNIKFNTFCEWLNELDSKVSKCNVVSSNTIEQTLKKLHSFTEEHMEKQALFIEIEDNFKNFDNNSAVQQSIMQFKVIYLNMIFNVIILN